MGLVFGCPCVERFYDVLHALSQISVACISFLVIGQVIAITYIYQQFFMQAILPVLILLGIPTGLCMALLANQVLIRLQR